MKNKFIRILALVLCLSMFLSPSVLFAIAETEDTTEDGDKEKEWEDVWEEDVQPAYTKSPFDTVQDRIEGDGNFIAPMTLYAVVDGYAFYGDGLTGEMIFLSLKDKTLTKDQIPENTIPEYTAFYCTNPYNAGSSTSSTASSEKEKLLSQIIIEFEEGETVTSMSSFTNAAASKQITVKNIRGGVRVEYTIGREQVIYLVPRLIKIEKLDELIKEVEEDPHPDAQRAARTLASFYIKYDINAPGVPETRKQKWKAQYPIVEKFPIYACDDTITTQELLRLERIIKQYTTYDYDRLEADHAETEYVSKDKAPPLFKLALEYKVEGKEIVIRCNAGNIRFDSSLYKLSDVLVLPYGGAGDTDRNSGYIFSPDGSGSLIDFEDLKQMSTFNEKNSLYGQDYAYHTITGQNREIARLPVFGLCQTVPNGQPVIDPESGAQMIEGGKKVYKPLQIAYFAIIEEGDSLAKINMTFGGTVHEFASIYTSFNPRPKDTYVLDGGISAGTDALWTVESKRKYTGDFQIRLFILDGTEDGDVSTVTADADKSYSDMAAAYRNYLIRTGVLKPIEDLEEDIPLYIETLGALETKKTVLGVPVDTMIALTSFEDIQTIIGQLSEKDVNNVKVKMNAWYNGGIMADIATSLKIEKVLGGEDGFKELVAYAKEHGVTLFPEIELTFAYRDKAFDGFKAKDNLAQTIDERNASLQEYDPVLQVFNKSLGGVISPNFMNKLYDSAYKEYGKFDVGAISVGSVGKYLSSDFNNDNPLTREDSKELVSQLLEKISENNEKVLVTAGNEYTLPYVTDILEIPLDDSRFRYSYATVPFMSMVLHGYKEYSGTALNLAGDYDYHLLKTIESGASPYFVVAMNNTSELKAFTVAEIAKYYSVRYNIWFKDIVEAYNTINDAISDVQNADMIKHELLDEDGKVAKVTYSNGIIFYINYGEEEYIVKKEGDDIKIAAGDFVKVYPGEGK